MYHLLTVIVFVGKAQSRDIYRLNCLHGTICPSNDNIWLAWGQSNPGRNLEYWNNYVLPNVAATSNDEITIEVKYGRRSPELYDLYIYLSLRDLSSNLSVCIIRMKVFAHKYIKETDVLSQMAELISVIGMLGVIILSVRVQVR